MDHLRAAPRRAYLHPNNHRALVSYLVDNKVTFLALR